MTTLFASHASHNNIDQLERPACSSELIAIEAILTSSGDFI